MLFYIRQYIQKILIVKKQVELKSLRTLWASAAAVLRLLLALIDHSRAKILYARSGYTFKQFSQALLKWAVNEGASLSHNAVYTFHHSRYFTMNLSAFSLRTKIKFIPK